MNRTILEQLLLFYIYDITHCLKLFILDYFPVLIMHI